MSRRGWARQRAELFGEHPRGRSGEPSRGRAREAAPRERRELVGKDLAERPRRARRRSGLRLPFALGAIAAALLLVTLRVEILRLRYALAEVASQEEELLERSRQTTVRVRELRDPARLAKLAAERGFGRPERVLSLEVPAPPAPAVAAAPDRPEERP
jgi:hypothetical protein